MCVCSVAKSCPTLCDSMDCRRPSSSVLHYLWSWLKFMSIESVMPSNHLILSLPFLQQVAKVLEFNFSNSSFNEYSELISFRIDWFDLLAVQGTLKSLLQHHNLKASVLQGSAFFMVQLSNPYTTIGKTKALTMWTYVSAF